MSTFKIIGKYFIPLYILFFSSGKVFEIKWNTLTLCCIALVHPDIIWHGIKETKSNTHINPYHRGCGCDSHNLM